ncbi:MAG: sensor histidine kinase [Actinobacteria bacterium]|nr:sensor histidine kinase [Actinomycetota bacterium]
MADRARDGRGAPEGRPALARAAAAAAEADTEIGTPYRTDRRARMAGAFIDAPGLDGASGWARLRLAIASPGAKRWYPGAGISLLFAVGFVIVPILVQVPSPESILWSIAILIYSTMFIFAFPVSIALPRRWRLAPPVVLLLSSLAFLPALHSDITGLWVYVAVSAALCLSGGRAMIAVLAIAVLAALLNWFGGILWPTTTPVWAMPLVIGSVGTLMAAFSRNLQTMQQLRATQRELATVAVEEERGRVARDMHDILGHSLSAIALKADLAAKLADRDPAAAAHEIREVQTLARATLGDMRAVVSGYRQVRIASELASLRTLLPAAGITAHLPTTTDDVPERNRELFGWALREAVTNVIRHAGATNCWVTLGPNRIAVEDDGVGPAPQSSAGPAGTGLHGLAERAADAGGALAIGRSRHGGFLVEVTA